MDNGSVKSWVDDFFGELGLGDANGRGSYPGDMSDDLPAVPLGIGCTAVHVASYPGYGYHTCAVLDNSDVKCWGWNGDGQLGLGDTANRGRSPGQMGDDLPAVPLGSGRTVEAVAAGALHSCALLDNGSVKCWA